jgi:hypothetical protein
MTGVPVADPSLLLGLPIPELGLGLPILGSPVWNPKAVELKPNEGVKRQMDRNTAKLLENIVLPDWILEYLRCPQSSGKLLPASQAVLNALSERAHSGTLVTVLGRTISQIPSQGLVSADGRWFYVANDSIVSLMADEAVPL